MADLTDADVRALARALELPMTEEDAAEVTHRLNAFIETLAPLADLPAGGPEATPAPTPRCTKPPTQSKTCTRGAVSAVDNCISRYSLCELEKIVRLPASGFG